MKPFIQMKTSKELVMTQTLQKALKLLQMPFEQVESHLEEIAERNPLLDFKASKTSQLFEEFYEKPISLSEHLENEIREHFSSSKERILAHKFTEFIDEKGTFFLQEGEIASKLSISIEETKKMIERLQKLSPKGIFARSIQETLLLQIENKNDPLYMLIQEFFRDLLEQRFNRIKKRFSDLTSLLKKLSRLELDPLKSFRSQINLPLKEDLRLFETGNGWHLSVPSFDLSLGYQSVQPTSKEEKRQIHIWKNEVKFLEKALSKRKALLLKVASYLVQKQHSFLSGKGALKPLTLQKIAEEIDIHESTLSRTLSDKYAITPIGLIPIKSLISKEKEGVKEILKNLISKENKNRPLTDIELKEKLNEKGYPIARRTIVKYRKELQILSRKLRKEGS